jgi:hypothetical protein
MSIHHALSSELFSIRQERGPHLPDAAAHAETPMFSTGHVEVLDDHGADSSSEKAACLQAGDDGARSIVKGQTSFNLLDLAMVPPTWMAWTPTVAAFIAPRIATSSIPQGQACPCEPATRAWRDSPCRLTAAERRAPGGFRRPSIRLVSVPRYGAHPRISNLRALVSRRSWQESLSISMTRNLK